MDQFWNVYEVVFKDCFGDYVGFFCYQVKQCELGLYIGWEVWVWCGMYVDCFWMVVVYIEVDLVFVCFDVSFGVVQFCQYGIQGIWLCVMVEDFVVGNCCGYQESFGFNMVRQYMVDVVVQVLYVFDGNVIVILVCDFCVQCVQEVGGIDNFWFVSGVFNNCCFFCKCCCVYDGYGGVDVYFIYYNMCVFQVIVD